MTYPVSNAVAALLDSLATTEKPRSSSLLPMRPRVDHRDSNLLVTDPGRVVSAVGGKGAGVVVSGSKR